MDLFDQLQEIVASALKVSPDEIQRTTSSDDLEAWDSLGHVHIMIAIESAFNIYMDVEDFAEMDGIPAMLEFLSTQELA